MDEARVVLCMKWGTLYSPDYVNVLFRAVRANLGGPFRFVCLTNDASGLDSRIEVYPIPKLPLRPEDWRHGAWPKLGVFVGDLWGLRGRALFIDLDSVIVGRLEPFFDLSGPLILLDGGKNWKRGGTAPPLPATGVFAFTLGSLSHIVEDFRADPAEHVARYELEQAFVGAEVHDAGYWPQGWVLSFKRHLRRPVGVDRLLPPKAPPATAKIIAFHGEPRPIALVRDERWASFPRAGRGPVPWMAEYWARHLNARVG